MAYTLPIEGESAESLYKQAMFFYDQYEKQKAENERLKKAVEYHSTIVKQSNAKNERLLAMLDKLKLEFVFCKNTIEAELSKAPSQEKAEKPSVNMGGVAQADSPPLASAPETRGANITAIVNEYERAAGKFGPFRSTHEGIAVIREEYLELEHEIFHGDIAGATLEAVQLGAMALRLLEDVLQPDAPKPKKVK